MVYAAKGAFRLTRQASSVTRPANHSGGKQWLTGRRVWSLRVARSSFNFQLSQATDASDGTTWYEWANDCVWFEVIWPHASTVNSVSVVDVDARFKGASMRNILFIPGSNYSDCIIILFSFLSIGKSIRVLVTWAMRREKHSVVRDGDEKKQNRGNVAANC